MKKAIQYSLFQLFFLINFSASVLSVITDEEYTVKVFDVGQGNAIGIRYKFKEDNTNKCETMLIDAGSTNCTASVQKHNDYYSTALSSEDYQNEIIQDIQDFMLVDGAVVKSIVVTHAHDDHYNILDQIFDIKKRREKIEHIVLSGSEGLYSRTRISPWLTKFSSEFPNKEVISYTRRQKGKTWFSLNKKGFKKRVSFTEGGCPPKIKLLSINQGKDSTNRNDDSIVLQVLCAQALSILLTGDATAKTWQGVKKIGNTHSHILLVPHHGSRANMKAKTVEGIIFNIFDIIQPSIAIFSTGLYSRYAHPHNDVYEKLEEKMVPRSDDPLLLSFFDTKKRIVKKYTNNSIFSTVDHGSVTISTNMEPKSTKVPFTIELERSQEPIFQLENKGFEAPMRI